MTLQTEFEFTLPRGYVDREGNVHKQGTMRLATAMDEIAPLALGDLLLHPHGSPDYLIGWCLMNSSLVITAGVDAGHVTARWHQ